MPATHTDLLDRYLQAVKFWLPKAQQDDILAELAEDLTSLMEDRESALGRAFTEDDLAALLKKRGSPMTVAAGYLPEQRLINPALLPVYLLVLKIVLLWVLLPLFVIVFIGPLFASTHPERVTLAFCGEAFRVGFMVVGIVTAVFALLDRYRIGLASRDNWDPRKLPRVALAQETSARWNHLAGFIFGVIAAVIWVVAMWQRTTFYLPGGLRIVLAPVWQFVYWPSLVICLTTASVDLLSFVYPCWTRFRPRARVGIDAATLAVAIGLLSVTSWVELAGWNLSAAELAVATRWANGSMHVGMIATAVIAIGDAIVQIRQLHRGSHGKPSPLLTV